MIIMIVLLLPISAATCMHLSSSWYLSGSFMSLYKWPTLELKITNARDMLVKVVGLINL